MSRILGKRLLWVLLLALVGWMVAKLLQSSGSSPGIGESSPRGGEPGDDVVKDAPRSLMAPAGSGSGREADVSTPQRAVTPEVLRLRFIDSSSGVPVASVGLWLRPEGSWTPPIIESRSDHSGVIEVAQPRTRSVACTDHPEYLTSEFRIELGESGDQTISLSPALHICGRVVTKMREPVSTQPSVLAFPESHPPTKQELFQALHSKAVPTAGYYRTTADADGFFDLGSVAPDRRYTLMGGGNGWVTVDPMNNVDAGSTGIELISDPLFGIDLELREEGGGPVRTNAGLWEAPGPRWFWDSSLARGLGTDSLQAVLAGLDPIQTMRNPSTRMVLLFVALSGSRVGPISFEGTLLGYAPCRSELWADPVTHSIPHQTLEMSARASGWGNLLVEFSGLRTLPVAHEDTRVQEIGFLLLQATESSRTFQFKLHDLTNRLLRIEGVPLGAYAVGLHTSGGYLNFAPREGRTPITILDRDTTVHFDLADACEVEIRIRCKDGKEYSGAVAVEVSRELQDGQTHSSFVNFTSSPFVIRGLLPASYGFTVYGPYYSGQPKQVDLRTEMDEARRVYVVFDE